MRTLISLCCVFALVGCAEKPTPEPAEVVAAEPAPQPVAFDAGGLKIGDLLTEQWAFSHCPSKDKGDPDIRCADYIKTANGNIAIWFQFSHNKLAGVTLEFESSCFDSLVASYSEKFGVPPHKRSTEPVTTNLGAKYENQSVTWHTLNGDFVLKKYGATITEGIGVLVSDEMAEFTARTEKANQDALKGKL